MRSFRLLKADEIECRVLQAKKNGVTVLLYKTARTDAALLDETYGPLNWACDYKVIDGSLYCGIGIKDTSCGEWVWKWNCGSESDMEAEKGRASDALKRAGFVLGLGTELYSAPFIFIPSTKVEIKESGTKYTCYAKFDVTKIGYDDAERINELEISVDGEVVWKMGKQKPEKKEDRKPSDDKLPEQAVPILRCEDCNKEIMAYKTSTGWVYPPRHAEGSKKKFGKVLCLDCIEKLNR